MTRRIARLLQLPPFALLASALMIGPAAFAGGFTCTAYVANEGGGVMPVDVLTQIVGAAITVGSGPTGIAATPDGAFVYVTNAGSDSVTPISTGSNFPGTSIPVGTTPVAIAITPDGATAYVVNEGSNDVTPIDVLTGIAGSPISVGLTPRGIVITPDGATAYVSNFDSDTVTPIDIATNLASSNIPVGTGPYGLAVTPDGATIYVADSTSNTVTPIDVATNISGSAISVPGGPTHIAISPDGATAYIVNNIADNVRLIDVATNTPGVAVSVGAEAFNIAITPDASTAFVSNSGNNTLTPITLASNLAGSAIAVGSLPKGIALANCAAAAAQTCIWNPAGAGPDNWSNPGKWTSCSGAGAGSGPLGTPRFADTAQIGSGNPALDLPVSVAGLTLSGGILLGDHSITVTDDFTWSGGELRASNSSFELIVDSSANATLLGGQKNLNGRKLSFTNTLSNWTTGLIELSNGAQIDISGSSSFVINPGAAEERIYFSGVGAEPQISNLGSMVKVGTNVAGIDTGINLTSSGSMQIAAGVLKMRSRGTSDGTTSISGGATLEVAANNFDFLAGAIISGGGRFNVGDLGPTPGVYTVADCIGLSGPVTIRNATLNIGCGSTQTFQDLRIEHNLAVLSGSANMAVAANMQWQNGTILGSGAPTATFTLNGGANAIWPNSATVGPRILESRDFLNMGSILINANNNATGLKNNSRLVNMVGANLTLDIGSGIATLFTSGVGTPELLNQGNLTVQTGGTWAITSRFTNSGSVNLTGPIQLYLQGAGTDIGSYSVDTTSQLYIDSPAGIRTIAGSGSISGNGALLLGNGGQLTVTAPTYTIRNTIIGAAANTQLDLSTGATVSVQELTLLAGAVGGTLTGTSPIETTVDFQHLQGLITTTAAGTPSLTVSGSASWSTAAIKTYRQRALVINGTANWSGGDIALESGASMAIQPTRTLNTTFPGTNGQITCISVCSSSFTNLGNFNKTAAGTMSIDSEINFSQQGNLSVQGGTLEIPTGFTQSNGQTVIAAGATLELQTGTLAVDAGLLTGTGLVNGAVTNNASLNPGSSPGILTISGNYTQSVTGSLQIQVAGLAPGTQHDVLNVGGQANLNGALVVQDFGFTPTPPDAFAFLNASGGVTGLFSSSIIPYAGYTPTYGANSVILSALGGIVVNSVGDPGDGVCNGAECTLREAINAANSLPGPDNISFNIIGCIVTCVIAPVSPLPTISTEISIDGYSQPGAAPNTNTPDLGLGSNAVIKIELDGTLIGPPFSPGMVINAPAALVKVEGMAIYNFATSSGITINGPANSAINLGGLFLGLRANGGFATPGPNGAQERGLAAGSGVVQVGDGGARSMNVIAGNAAEGLLIGDGPPVGRTISVQGNLIGTAPDGTTARANAIGISVNSNATIPGITIGGSTPALGNVIARNSGVGINVQCALSSGTCLDGMQIIGNFIGTDVNNASIGNGGDGIFFSELTNGRVIVGGTSVGSANVIRNNGGDGIGTANFSGAGPMSFLINRFGNNTGIAIDLRSDGETPNDAGDGDFGPNGTQNYPEILRFDLAPDGASAEIEWIIDSLNDGTNYPMRVDFYQANGNEFDVWLGTANCADAAPAPCISTVVFPNGVIVAPGASIASTATDNQGRSSEAGFYAPPLPTTTTITAINPVTTVVGQPYSVEVAVEENGNPVSSGVITVTQLSDGSTCEIVLLPSKGLNSCELTGHSAITTVVRAVYQGDLGLAPSTSVIFPHVVNRAATQLQIVSDGPDPSLAGSPITVTVSLNVTAPGVGNPSGNLLVTDGSSSCGITLPNLSCELIPKASGLATLEARYLGDANFSASVDTEPHTITADGADLSIIKRNGLRVLPGGGSTTYILLVSNDGPQAVVNARVTDILPSQLTGANWNCAASEGASCPQSGAGNIDALVNIAPGASLTFELSVNVQRSPEQVVSNLATIAAPTNATDSNLLNNQSADVDPIGIFGDGLESENE